MLWPFGINILILVCGTKKYLATKVATIRKMTCNFSFSSHDAVQPKHNELTCAKSSRQNHEDGSHVDSHVVFRELFENTVNYFCLCFFVDFFGVVFSFLFCAFSKRPENQVS
jgi:hypothetical protein